MSKKAFRTIDLLIFSVIACFIEALNVWGSSRFVTEGYSVSFGIVITLIAIYRWGAIGTLVGAAGFTSAMLMHSFLYPTRTTTAFILSYIIGNCFVGFVSFFFRYRSKEKISQDTGLLMLYTVLGYCASFIGVALMAMIFQISQFFVELLAQATVGIINLVIGCIVMIIAKKQRNFLMDMSQYLTMMHTVPESARIRKETLAEKKTYSSLEELANSDEVSDIALLDGGTLSEDQLKELNQQFKEKEGERVNGKS